MFGSLDDALSPTLGTLESLRRQGPQPPSSSLVGCPLRERAQGSEVLRAVPPSQHSPWSLLLSPAPHLAVRCLGGSPRIRPLVELAPPPLHFSCRPIPWPRPPLSSLMERGAQRGAQPLSLWNLLPRLSDGETIWSVLWAVEKAESRKM